MSSIKDLNLKPNIICSECFCFQLLGINFNNENKNLSDVCEIYSYCSFKHNNKCKNTIKNTLDNIFSNKKTKIYFDGVKCDFCEKNNIEYHCIQCQRNVCRKCFIYHNTHKYYYNRNYISEEEINKIKNKFTESQQNIKNNLDLINEKINEFELELKKLKELYNAYKDINDKLTSFSNYILKIYIDLAKSSKSIYYPIYFNIKNILSFNPLQLKFFQNDISIRSFTKMLNEKLNSGFYFFITSSDITDNLYDYNKFEHDIINYNKININEFHKIEIEYDKIFPYTDNKFIGIKDKNDINMISDIYHIKNQKIETALHLYIEKIFYNKEYNILIVMSSKSIIILDPKDYSIKQIISANHKTKMKKITYESYIWGVKKNTEFYYDVPKGLFISINIISNISFFVIFRGDVRSLGEKCSELFNKLKIDKIINNKGYFYNSYRYQDYDYLIIYEKENEIAIPKTIIFLLQNNILSDDARYVTGKYVEIEDPETYCSFNFISMNKITDNKYIITYKSKIEIDRDQYYYYITDKRYNNEIIYYYLYYKDKNYYLKKIGSTEENSYLFKNEKNKIFYFLYSKSTKCSNDLSKILTKKNKLKAIKFNTELNLRNILIQNNNVIFWDDICIYYGKIIDNNLEINNTFKIGNNQIIKYVSLKDKYIFFSHEEPNEIDNDSRNMSIDENSNKDESVKVGNSEINEEKMDKNNNDNNNDENSND